MGEGQKRKHVEGGRGGKLKLVEKERGSRRRKSEGVCKWEEKKMDTKG